MIPSPIYCKRCGGFTGEHKMTKTGKDSKGEHKHLEDCIEELSKALRELRREVQEANEWP